MFRHLPHVFGILLCTVLASQAQGNFTLNIGAAPIPALPLVKFDDVWRYHLGTNAPQADWKTQVDDGEFDENVWGSGPGGFGYEDGDDNTLLLVMSNRCSTLYIRKVFELPTGIDPSRALRLTMDWDDGFIAYIDGVEVARSPNAPAGEPPHTAVSNPPNHEASRGPGGNPPTTYDLGSVGSRLSPGFHVLAIMGLNGSTVSGDFSLIADLFVAGTLGGAEADGFFALVRTNTITLSGSNTLANAARVTVNGFPANYDPLAGTWSRVQTLQPGMNRLFIASLDQQGNILGSINKDIVAELNSVTASGTISANTTWSGSVRVANEVLVTSGATLTITPGTVVLLGPTGSLRATNNSTIDAVGTLEQRVYFLPADANTAWRELTAIGANSLLWLTYAETVAGRTRAERGGTALVEDSTLRDMASNIEMIVGLNGAALTLRRTHVLRFGELDSRDTPLLIEDCLMERTAVDCLDIKTPTTTVPLTVRRSTLRFGATVGGGPPDSDGVDLGPGAATIENCLIHDFDDKGVSIGSAAHGSIVRNSLIYNCDMGISAYSSSNILLINNTISGSRYGVLFTNNPTPAIGVATNLILWDNINNLSIFNTASLQVSYSDVQGGASGQGNIDANPLFRNAATGDFRLTPGSPAIGSGFGGADMGALFPVGGIPSAPWNLAALVDGTNAIYLNWLEDADNETAFLIERSINAVDWQYLFSTNPNQTYYIDDSAAADTLYFYRVRAENSSGVSDWSNPATGIRQVPITYVGGTLSQNTTWSGAIVVTSTVTVPNGITLTMLPATSVTVTNNAAIRATAGGIINVAGTRASPVTLRPPTAGTTWLELSADGANAALTVRHAEVIGGRTAVRNGAAGLMEDSYFHDFRLASCSTLDCPIMMSSFASSMVVRRCHIREYYETLFRDGVITIEDCLFEYMSGDALDFDGAQTGTVLRRSTFRHGIRAPSNIDAVDVGPGQLGACRNVIIEDCLMFDFPTDKGVSIGDAPNQAIGTVVRNCLIYGCLSGVQVKDGGFAEVYQCTIVSNRWGFTNYNKSGSASLTGGHTTNAHNNILWDNQITISMWNNGTLTSDHSILGNTNWPGVGNINVDPLFVNAAQRDYRLAPNSPARGAGRDGADLGARFPVGSVMARSHPEFQSIQRFDYGVRLTLWADSEHTYTIYHGPTVTGPWTVLELVPSPARPTLMEIFDPLPAHANPENRFYRLVFP